MAMSQNEAAAQLSGPGVWQPLFIECRPGTLWVDISKQMAKAVKRSGVREGSCSVYAPRPSSGVLAGGTGDSLESVELVMAIEERLGAASTSETRELEKLVERLSPKVSARFEIHKGKLALAWGEGI